MEKRNGQLYYSTVVMSHFMTLSLVAAQPSY